MGNLDPEKIIAALRVVERERDEARNFLKQAVALLKDLVSDDLLPKWVRDRINAFLEDQCR